MITETVIEVIGTNYFLQFYIFLFNIFNMFNTFIIQFFYIFV